MTSAILSLWMLVSAIWTAQGPEQFTPEEPEFENVAVDHTGLARLAPAFDERGAPDCASVWRLAESPGGVYIGTGNTGRVYLLGLDQSLSLIHDAGAGEVLALCPDPGAGVFFGVSPEARVYRARPGQDPSLVFETGEDYVFDLLPGVSAELYCATGTKGRLYRIIGGRAKPVFSAPQANLTALAWFPPDEGLLVGTAPDGLVYRLRFSPGRTEPEKEVLYDTPLAEVRSIAADDSLVYIAANPGEDSDSDSGPAVFCVNAEGILQWQWACPESTLFGILLHGPGLLVATGSRGLVYRLDDQGNATVFQKAIDSDVICFAPGENGTWVGTANPARILLLEDELAGQGHLVSAVHDCEGPARLGLLTSRAEVPAGTKLRFSTRSGNSEAPDSTWSQWQSASGKVASPVGRFVQWRAEFESEFPNLTPELERVDLSYRIPNRAPVLSELALSRPTLEEARAGQSKPVRELSWQAEDPDHDSLAFELHYRKETETRWKLLAEDLTGSPHEFDTRTLSDGWYRFQVEASDRVSRPLETARQTVHTALPVPIDNTPPAIKSLRLQGASLSFTAADDVSLIAGCRVSVNAGPWFPAEPLDGIFDSQEERFSVRVELEPGENRRLAPGENTVAVWAADWEGNTVTATTTRR